MSKKITFEFVNTAEKTLAKSTLKNYKAALNTLAKVSVFEHERDPSKALIANKEDLLNHTETVLYLIKEHTNKRQTTVLLSAIFSVIGKQDEKHPYVTAFRTAYYSEEYKKKLIEEGKLVPETKIDSAT